MSGGETVVLRTEIVVSSEEGELPDNGVLEDLLGAALFHRGLDEEDNIFVIAVEVRGRYA